MMSSRRWRVWGVLPLVAALAGGIGCAAEGGATEGPETAEGAAQAAAAGDEADGPGGPHARRHPGRGGPEHLLVAALRELDLTDAQRSAIQGALDGIPAPKARGPKDGAPFAALAEGVRAGKIDEAAVLARAGAPDRDFEAHRDAVAGALRTLHATLSKEQRRALVDAVAERMEERGPKGDHPGKLGERGPGGERAGKGGPLGHLLGGLDLTDEQEEAIERALASQRPAAPDAEAMKKRFEAGRAEMRARLEGFAADTFDAKVFLAPPGGDAAHGPKQHLERLVKTLALVAPILEPAQREALAARLEKGPPMGPPHGPPGAPPPGR